MSDDSTNPPTGDGAAPGVTPPPLPAVLLDPRPLLAVCTLAWVIAAIAAFTVPGLETWRPVTLAGVGLGGLGTLMFLWQRHAARSGWRGAQTGLQ